MASFASSATTCGARKHAWTKRKKKVGENNGQLSFVRHRVWRTQARLDQLLSKKFLLWCDLSNAQLFSRWSVSHCHVSVSRQDWVEDSFT